MRKSLCYHDTYDNVLARSCDIFCTEWWLINHIEQSLSVSALVEKLWVFNGKTPVFWPVQTHWILFKIISFLTFKENNTSWNDGQTPILLLLKKIASGLINRVLRTNFTSFQYSFFFKSSKPLIIHKLSLQNWIQQLFYCSLDRSHYRVCLKAKNRFLAKYSEKNERGSFVFWFRQSCEVFPFCLDARLETWG